MQSLHPRRARSARRFIICLISFSPFLMLGCRTPLPQGPSPGQQALAQIQQGVTAEQNAFGLHRVDIPQSQGILFVKAPRPHLERFDRLSIDAIEIKPIDGDLPWNTATTNRLRKSFARTLKKSIERQDTWQMMRGQGPGILRLRVIATELDIAKGLPPVSAGRYSKTRHRNRTTLVMELYDSTNNELLVQFIQRRNLPPKIYAGTNAEMDRLRLYYSRFASSMGDSLAELAQAVKDVSNDDRRKSPH